MTCPGCGRPSPDGAARCASCGASLPTRLGEAPQAPPGRSGAPVDAPTVTGGAVPSGGTSPGGFGEGLARLVPGASLGTRYEIQALLGEGGMGAVYKAHDRVLGRTVAIKVIRPEMASHPEVLDRFKREILLASKVTHRNVLRIHDLGEAGDVKFISMNYVEGSNLSDLLKREGPLSAGRALPLVRQIADALQAAHEAGIVHRDLKPQNVLIDREGNAYIADFGISRSIEAGGTMTEAGTVLGSVDYMSPEQARGERPDRRGDIYSLGVILFEIFTGTLPFSGGSALSVMMKRLHEEPRPVRKIRPEVPAFIADIISRALRRDPADRYQSVAELLRDLERGRASVSWRRVRRRAGILAAAGLVLASAIAAGVFYLRTRPSAPTGPRSSLAILPFQNGTGDPRYDWARTGLQSLLRDDLLQAKDLRLVGEDRVQEILETLRTPEGEESRPATMRKVASLIGAEHVLAGRLLKIADRLRIEASLQGAGSQEAPGSPLLVDGGGDEAIPSMLRELTGRVRDELGVSRGWLERARGATEPSTRSAEALAMYYESLALARAGQHLVASKRLEAAVQKDPGFSLARALLAETYDTLGYSDKASAEAERAAAGLGSSSPYEAARIRATLARLKGDPEAAEKAYSTLCEITPSDAEAFFSLASAQEDRRNLLGALGSLRRAVALDPGHPKARFELGKLQYENGNRTEALQEFNVALDLYNDTGNDEGKSTVLNGLGNVYRQLGRYDEALARFQGALDIRRRIGDQRGIRVSLTNLAITYGNLGRHAEAIQTLQEALATARQMGDRLGLGKTYSELGNAYLVSGHAEEAMKAFQESLKIFRERGVQDPAGEAGALSNIGTANTSLGRYAEGLYALKDALAKRREIGDKSEIISSLSDIGDNEWFQGGYEDALKYYTEGLSLAREADNKPYVILFLGNLSNIHEDQGEYGAALSLLAEAEKLAREIKDNTLAQSLIYLGSIRSRLGDFSGAETALDEALQLARQSGSIRAQVEALISRAALHLARGEPDRAATVSREALGMAKSSNEPRPLLLARLQAGEAARSVGDLDLVLKEAESAGLLPIVGAARLALARVRLAAGHPREALREAELAAGTATALGQRDLLFRAHSLAGKALKQQGEIAGAAGQFAAALDPLEEMCRGLKDAPLKFFLARPETAGFRADTEEVFLAMKRESDLGRLREIARIQP